VAAHYKAPFGVEKEDIGLENAYSWDLSPEQSSTWRGPTPPRPSTRAVLCYLGVRKMGLTSASIAKELGISPSAVTRGISRASQVMQGQDIEEQLVECQ
jgi:hypothetical protein